MPANADYYTGPEEDMSSSEDPMGGPPPETESEDSDYESALIPKSLVGDVQPGDTITLKVLHAYEDEYEVCMADEEESPPTPMEEAESKLDMMAESPEV